MLDIQRLQSDHEAEDAMSHIARSQREIFSHKMLASGHQRQHHRIQNTLEYIAQSDKEHSIVQDTTTNETQIDTRNTTKDTKSILR